MAIISQTCGPTESGFALRATAPSPCGHQTTLRQRLPMKGPCVLAAHSGRTTLADDGSTDEAEKVSKRRTTLNTRTWLAAVAVLATVVAGSPAVAAVQQDTVGVVDETTGVWYLRGPTGDTTSFYYGDPWDYAMVGDWDCDTIDTPGLYRQSDGYVYLRNSNTQGVADIRFYFGNAGDIPLAGDFNGDGCDTVSIYRPSQGRVFIINQLGANDGGLGAADYDYYFGNPGDKPFVGDFNNNGQDTVGLHRESTGLVYYRNTHTQGIADYSFIYGDPGDKIIAGRWVQDPTPGPDTVGHLPPLQRHRSISASQTRRATPTPSSSTGTSTCCPSPDTSDPWSAATTRHRRPGSLRVITNIVDGDTLDVLRAYFDGVDWVQMTFRVRLIGIDAPEVGDCYYNEAKNRLASLVSGQTVWLVKDVSEVDRYGRLLRYIYTGGQHINKTMIDEGYAVAVEYPPTPPMPLCSPQPRAKHETPVSVSGAPAPARSRHRATRPIQPCASRRHHRTWTAVTSRTGDSRCSNLTRTGFDGDKDGVGCES